MTLEAIAARLREAEASATPIPPVRDQLSSGEAAYEVQQINTAQRISQGARLVGRKVGLTNPVVQQQLGVDQPDYGMLFDDMEVLHDGLIPWSEGAQFKVEAEIALIIGRDLPDPKTTMAELIRAVDYALPAIEIVGSRIANWDISFVDTVADNGSSAFYTLGSSPRRLETLDLLDCQMTMEGTDGSHSAGAGRACWGSPLNAALWLARTMAASAQPLLAGDVILTGALGPMITATPGTRYVAQIDGLGEASVRFGAAV
ncbi:MAG: 2-keto-4-pentenoate hydratase [Halomonas sp.]|nr:fumarylacetoacetate hydrolase family protein [Halomonas sp.]TVP44626.1 MAG: 2-keto-4-pentenoate hydratase [Halomonas sp.]